MEARGLAPKVMIEQQLRLADRLRLARGRDQLDGILDQRRIDIDAVRRLLQGQQLLGVDRLLHRLEGAGHPLDDDELLGGRGITDQHLEHEAVDLRFRQRIGAFRLDGVLGGHHQKGIGHLERFAANGHLPLLHHLAAGRFAPWPGRG